MLSGRNLRRFRSSMLPPFSSLNFCQTTRPDLPGTCNTPPPLECQVLTNLINVLKTDPSYAVFIHDNIDAFSGSPALTCKNVFPLVILTSYNKTFGGSPVRMSGVPIS